MVWNTRAAGDGDWRVHRHVLTSDGLFTCNTEIIWMRGPWAWLRRGASNTSTVKPHARATCSLKVKWNVHEALWRLGGSALSIGNGGQPSEPYSKLISIYELQCHGTLASTLGDLHVDCPCHAAICPDPESGSIQLICSMGTWRIVARVQFKGVDDVIYMTKDELISKIKYPFSTCTIRTGLVLV